MLFLACIALRGSTFIVAKSGDAVVVGTDSRVTLIIDYNRKQIGPDICKIHKFAQGRYFVIATNQYFNIKTGIDFSRLAMETLAGKGSPKALADLFESRAKAATERILKEDGQPTVLSLVFFGYDSGPFYYSRSVRRNASGIYEEPLDCAAGCSEHWVAGGYHEVIDKFAPQMFSTISMEGAIPSLIRKEIDADKTGDIGLPIALLRVDKDGEHWLSSGVCKPAQFLK